MILLVSHFTENKGTTDYFRDFLMKHGVEYYYLRHPFFFADSDFSELIRFDGKQESIERKYRKARHAILDLVRDFFVTLSVSYSLRKRIGRVFAFGSFNVLPFVLFKGFFSKVKVTFWGVDYSSKRFGNLILNRLYLASETLSCKYCDEVYQPSIRQEKARVTRHGLSGDKSSIVPNGIRSIDYFRDRSQNKGIVLIYIGSITPQHGLIGFIRSFYVDKKCGYKLHIIGGGEEEAELKAIIRENGLSREVCYHGSMTQEEIIGFLDSLQEKVFGIAPYDDKVNDHVYYCDSLKIREYLSYGIPYMTPDFISVDTDLTELGFRYGSPDDLERILQKDIPRFHLNVEKTKEVLVRYLWENIFTRVDLA